MASTDDTEAFACQKLQFFTQDRNASNLDRPMDEKLYGLVLRKMDEVVRVHEKEQVLDFCERYHLGYDSCGLRRCLILQGQPMTLPIYKILHADNLQDPANCNPQAKTNDFALRDLGTNGLEREVPDLLHSTRCRSTAPGLWSIATLAAGVLPCLRTCVVWPPARSLSFQSQKPRRDSQLVLSLSRQ